MVEYSPDSAIGKAKYESDMLNLVRKTKENFARVDRAFDVLSDPELRSEYDDARTAFLLQRDFAGSVAARGGSSAGNRKRGDGK